MAEEWENSLLVTPNCVQSKQPRCQHRRGKPRQGIPMPGNAACGAGGREGLLGERGRGDEYLLLWGGLGPGVAVGHGKGPT